MLWVRDRGSIQLHALHVEVISVLPTRTLEALGEQELDITRISSLLRFSVKEFLSVKDLTTSACFSRDSRFEVTLLKSSA